MSTIPQCPLCHDSGHRTLANGERSTYLDCGCGVTAERAAMNEFIGTQMGRPKDEDSILWSVHQRAKAMGRAEALAELHPLWLAEKERAERAEARIAELEAQLAQALVRESNAKRWDKLRVADNSTVLRFYNTRPDLRTAFVDSLPAAPVQQEGE